MAHSIIIETRSDRDFALFKELAERLGLRTQESYEAPGLSEAEDNVLLEKAAGSWQGDETVDQREMFRKTEQLRLKLKRIKVDSKLNLSELANEMLDTSL